jgi:hypothetical protein
MAVLIYAYVNVWVGENMHHLVYDVNVQCYLRIYNKLDGGMRNI